VRSWRVWRSGGRSTG